MMNLPPCPDCKARISLSATVCPRCGRHIKEGDLIVPQPKRLKDMSQGRLILVVLVVLFIIFAILNAPSK